jgi:DNA-binding XRE family transcriptional regulator
MNDQKYLERLGAHIRKLREEKEISQSELARLADKDRQSIHRLEKGEVNPSVLFLKQIAKALEVPLKDIFDFE